LNKLPFREIWAVDFEFIAKPGERPVPACLVARELRTGRELRIWQDDLRDLRLPPYPTGPDTLFVAYYASAELGCHLALGWPMPARVFDCFTEFRCLTNGRKLYAGAGLLGALVYYGLDSIGAEEKREMRELILSGGPWSHDERRVILDYCASDVRALEALLPCIWKDVSRKPMGLEHALLRGRSMAAASRMEWHGVPIDVPTLERLREHWAQIQDRLIAAVDADYGVYEGRHFRQSRFAAWLVRNRIPWPRTHTGALALDRDTFREMGRGYPQVAALRELRHTLAEMRLNDLAVGADGRNRCLLSAFRARTSRNQPSNTRFIFGPSTWLRGLIKPPPGYALAYVDFASQEVAIAAALSGDAALMAAYESGDVYMAFARQAGLAPEGATKATHKAVRDQCKAVVLGTQYGMGEVSLAKRIGQSPAHARRLLTAHRRTYPDFWRWSDAAVDVAMLHGRIGTVFGWTLQTEERPNVRSLRNFPCQANGAEMLRLAACLATEAGLEICAPVHDALVLAAPADRIDQDVQRLRACMTEAGRIVLGGFTVRTDAEIIRYPERYQDPRGQVMWQRVMRILDGLESDGRATLLLG
jgi:hypothetical protein